MQKLVYTGIHQQLSPAPYLWSDNKFWWFVFIAYFSTTLSTKCGQLQKFKNLHTNASPEAWTLDLLLLWVSCENPVVI